MVKEAERKVVGGNCFDFEMSWCGEETIESEIGFGS